MPRHTLGFEYIGAEDPSRTCAEELTDDAALIRVKRVLLDVNAVPYIPELFSAQNPPKPVSVRLRWNKFYFLSPLTEKSSAGTHRVVPELSTTTRHPSTGPPSSQRRGGSEKSSSI
jgi:hypothetical protein